MRSSAAARSYSVARTAAGQGGRRWGAAGRQLPMLLLVGDLHHVGIRAGVLRSLSSNYEHYLGGCRQVATD